MVVINTGMQSCGRYNSSMFMIVRSKLDGIIPITKNDLNNIGISEF